MKEIPNSELRKYKISDSCIFKKNNEEFGGLSNMSTSFLLTVNGLKVSSTEAIYQALKFPNDIDLQRKILIERSPFIAKMIAKKGVERPDWLDIRVRIMRWCLKLKLAQNYHSFGLLLKSTRDKDIVEYSKNDNFWGANKVNELELQGKNALGRLLMELRDFYLTNPIENCLVVPPPQIISALLLGREIELIDMSKKYLE